MNNKQARDWENRLRTKYNCSWQSIHTALYSDYQDVVRAMPFVLSRLPIYLTTSDIHNVSLTSTTCLRGVLENLLQKRLLSQQMSTKDQIWITLDLSYINGMYWALKAYDGYFYIDSNVMSWSNWNILLREFDFIRQLTKQMGYSLKTLPFIYMCRCSHSMEYHQEEHIPINEWNPSHYYLRLEGKASDDKPSTIYNDFDLGVKFLDTTSMLIQSLVRVDHTRNSVEYRLIHIQSYGENEEEED